MKPFSRFIGIFATALLVLSIVGSVYSASNAALAQKIGIQEGNIALDFTLYDLDGNLVKLSDSRGKVVLVNFWAEWCGYCYRERSSLNQLNEDYKDKGLVVLAVHTFNHRSKSVEEIKKYADALSPSLHILIDTDGKTAALYKISGVPNTFIIDRADIIRAVVGGLVDWDDESARLFIENMLSSGDE